MSKWTLQYIEGVMPGIRHLEGFVVARNMGFPGLGLVAHPRRILSRRGNIHLDYLWCSFFQEHEATHHSNSRPKGLLKWPCLIITIAYTAWCLQISECFQEKKKKKVFNSHLCEISLFSTFSNTIHLLT